MKLLKILILVLPVFLTSCTTVSPKRYDTNNDGKLTGKELKNYQTELAQEYVWKFWGDLQAAVLGKNYNVFQSGNAISKNPSSTIAFLSMDLLAQNRALDPAISKLAIPTLIVDTGTVIII